VINIACGEAITVNAIIDLINDLLGKDIKPKYEPSRPGDVKHSLAEITLAERIIGFKPVESFKSGLQKAINWYAENLPH
jgi:nucleoside-diphosphate-sugar epimerase